MDRIIALPRFVRRSVIGSRFKSTVPRCHFYILAGLILVVCLGEIRHTVPVHLIGLVAFFALALCYFVDTVLYQKTDQRLKAVFQASPNPIIVYDKEGCPMNINPAFTQIFGWTLDELAGRRIPFVPESEIEVTSRKIAEIFETGRPVSFETQRLTKAGGICDVIVSAAMATGRDHTPVEMVVNITDITERKRIETQLQHGLKMEALGTLAGGIAHDFNNILSPLIGFAEMLGEDLDAKSPLQDYVAELLSAGHRAKDLVNQILTFSRHSDADPQKLKLQPIISEALKLIRASIPATIRIKKEIEADCRPVIADPTQIHQIVMNLATNAYHAMENSGGTIDVNLKQVRLEAHQTQHTGLAPGKYARLVVADTGVGIDKHTMQKIFDPFFTTKDKNKGTGLGLSVVQGIVKSSGGEIMVFSKVGKGSEFHVYWPSAGHEVEKCITDPPAPSRGGAERILLVDDEQTIARMLHQVLERLGYQVSSHTSSTDALATFKADPGGFDLVLSDMNMPVMTGDQLVQEILAVRSSIPVIISTGYSHTLTPEMVKSMGIKAVLNKPVSKSKVADTVRKVLDEAAAFNKGAVVPAEN